MVELTAPYIPGFLGFREAPFIVDLFNELKCKNPEYWPHVVMVDGNGTLHPKGKVLNFFFRNWMVDEYEFWVKCYLTPSLLVKVYNKMQPQYRSIV